MQKLTLFYFTAFLALTAGLMLSFKAIISLPKLVTKPVIIILNLWQFWYYFVTRIFIYKVIPTVSAILK